MKDLRLILVETVLTMQKLPADKIVGLYKFGSLVYGTAHENSDYDYVVILDVSGELYEHFENKDLDIHIFSTESYKAKLDEHDIMALETFFNPHPIIKYAVDFKLDLVKLRHKISAIVSNSWVKAKKKVLLEDEDSFIGLKSLFHSIRILDLGIQLAEYGNGSTIVIDFESSRHIWKEILGMHAKNHSIEKILEHFKPQHNANASKFRMLAPKEYHPVKTIEIEVKLNEI